MFSTPASKQWSLRGELACVIDAAAKQVVEHGLAAVLQKLDANPHDLNHSRF